MNCRSSLFFNNNEFCLIYYRMKSFLNMSIKRRKKSFKNENYHWLENCWRGALVCFDEIEWIFDRRYFSIASDFVWFTIWWKIYYTCTLNSNCFHLNHSLDQFFFIFFVVHSHESCQNDEFSLKTKFWYQRHLIHEFLCTIDLKSINQTTHSVDFNIHVMLIFWKIDEMKIFDSSKSKSSRTSFSICSIRISNFLKRSFAYI